MPVPVFTSKKMKRLQNIRYQLLKNFSGTFTDEQLVLAVRSIVDAAFDSSAAPPELEDIPLFPDDMFGVTITWSESGDSATFVRGGSSITGDTLTDEIVPDVVTEAAAAYIFSISGYSVPGVNQQYIEEAGGTTYRWFIGVTDPQYKIRPFIIDKVSKYALYDDTFDGTFESALSTALMPGSINSELDRQLNTISWLPETVAFTKYPGVNKIGAVENLSYMSSVDMYTKIIG